MIFLIKRAIKKRKKRKEEEGRQAEEARKEGGEAGAEGKGSAEGDREKGIGGRRAERREHRRAEWRKIRG